MHAGSPSPERGIRTFGDLNPGSRLHGAHKYCHNGGIAFAPHHGVGLPRGPRRRSWPLPAVPRKWVICRGKRQGLGVRALWGPQWTRLPLPGRRKYCHNGAWPSPTSYGGLAAEGCQRGPPIAIVVLIMVPKKARICRGDSAEYGVRALWGSEGLVCLFTRARRSPKGAARIASESGSLQRCQGSMVGATEPFCAPFCARKKAPSSRENIPGARTRASL